MRAIHIAAAGLSGLLALGCGSADDPGVSTAPTTTAPETAIRLEVATSNGIIGTNQGDGTCDWGNTRYEVADADGSVIDAGALGVGTTTGQPIVDLVCHAEVDVRAPASPAYEIIITGSDDDPSHPAAEWGETRTVSDDEALAGIEFELDFSCFIDC